MALKKKIVAATGAAVTSGHKKVGADGLTKAQRAEKAMAEAAAAARSEGETNPARIRERMLQARDKAFRAPL